jgi:hypothetical protein
MIKLGEVIFDIVDNEEVNKSNEITDYPTEEGFSISDNSSKNPLELSITGMVQGDEAFNKLQTLRKYSDEGTELLYVGRNGLSNVVIQELSTIHDGTVGGGFKFSIPLKQIIKAELETTTIDFGVAIKQSVQGKTNQGLQSRVELPPDTRLLPEKQLNVPTIGELRAKIIADKRIEKEKKYENYVKTLPDRIKFIQGKPSARTKEESNAARRGITNARIR